MRTYFLKPLIGAVPLFLLTGCAMKFSQYSGSHRVWPVVTESMAETSFGLPVYRSWPDKPYDVIGSVRCEDPKAFWNDGLIGQAVDEARKHGGNAIIIRQGSEFAVSGNVGFAEDPMVWKGNQTTALVIKWKPKTVVEAEAAKLKAFKDEFQSKNPTLCGNPLLVDEAYDYLQRTGMNADSPGVAEKLKDVLTEIHDGREGEFGGKWLYRCTFKKSQLTGSQTDSLYGVAQVNLADNVLTVVSIAGPELSVSGTFDKGRISGKIGISGVSINGDGVASKEKISLSGQGQIADGTFQASLVFIR